MTRRNLLAMAPAVLRGVARGPNILLINTDDQRFDTIQALGNAEIQTPNLDRLVARGMSFGNLYSMGGMVGAMCLPSRTMLMTGRTVFRIPERNEPAGNYPLLPKTFEAAGYSTFHIGKRGNTYLAASQAFQKVMYSAEAMEQRAEQSETHATAVIDYINAHKGGNPFLVYMAPPVPHDPRVAPQKFMDLYDPAKLTLPKNFMPAHPFDNGDLKIRDEMLAAFPRTPEEMRRHLADYYACITCLDHHIGRVLDVVPENTIVLFTSDQGLAVGGRHGLMGKQNLYEHFKSPLIVAGPGIGKGRSAALAQMHDLFPTLCELAGVETPKGVEGLSLAGVIHGRQKQVREHVFGVYKDVQRMVRDARYKLIWYPKAGQTQLFDLEKDPWELRNLAGEARQARRVTELKKTMAELQERYGDKFAPRAA